MGNYTSQPNPYIDIFNDEERKEINEDMEKMISFEPRFFDFKTKYLNDFKKREIKNQCYFNSLLDNWDHQDVRPNIRVLVIISSNIEIIDLPKNNPKDKESDKLHSSKDDNLKNVQDDKLTDTQRENPKDYNIHIQEDNTNYNQEDSQNNKFEYNRKNVSINIHNNKINESFLKNSGDMATGLLICHIFRNAFGIPLSRMLITTTHESNACDNEHFCFYQNVNLAQVGEKQYKFRLDKELKSRIKLFNINTINDELSTTKDTHLFVFLLDHDSRNIFGYNIFQFYLEKLLQITCKHFFMFNDSFQSASITDITRTCIEFGEIFSNFLQSQFESTLFHFLSVVGTVNTQCFYDFIHSKLNETTDSDVINYKSEIEEAINYAFNNPQLQLKLINLINKLSLNHSGISCDPNLFIRFGQKATIFASSTFSGIALSLPVRRIHVFYHTHYRVCGSIFSSIYIESILSAPRSLNDFKNSINQIYQKYKDEFQSHLINQNKKKDKSQVNNNIIPESNIIEFFQMQPDDMNHFFSSIDIWPDLYSIATDAKYWNVDVSIVNPGEYDNICLDELLINNSILNIDIISNTYVPIKELSRLHKFLDDFENEVNLKLKKNKIEKDFKIENKDEDDDDDDEFPYKLGLASWGDFYYRIDPYILSNLARGVMKLERPIAKFFNEKSKFNSSHVVNLFCEAYITIFGYRKNYSL